MVGYCRLENVSVKDNNRHFHITVYIRGVVVLLLILANPECFMMPYYVSCMLNGSFIVVKYSNGFELKWICKN